MKKKKKKKEEEKGKNCVAARALIPLLPGLLPALSINSNTESGGSSHQGFKEN